MTTRRVDIRALRALAALAGERPYVDETGHQLYGIGVELWGDGGSKYCLHLPIREAVSWDQTVGLDGFYTANILSEDVAADGNEPLKDELYRRAFDAFIAEVAERLGMVEYRVRSLCEQLEGVAALTTREETNR